MKIAKNIKIIICDDVRLEVGNKVSLMGIYSGNLRVSVLKAILPMVNIVVMLEEVKTKFTSVIIYYTDPKGKKFPEISIQTDFDKDKSKNRNFITRISPYLIEDTGTAEFKVFFKNKDKILNEKDPVVYKIEIELAK